MKRTFFSLVVLALVGLALPRVQADTEVSVDFFYNNISGGNWIEVGDYGYCWQPDVAVSNTEWRPYSDGYWAYTDLGWTWVSYEDFGWATYHYGRWVRLADQGWVWAPGRDSELEWGPAWVSWRTGGDYIGWAPLSPEVRVSEGRGIGNNVDVEVDLGPGYYNFIETRYIGEPVLREHIVPVSQNVTYISQTVNVTNITYKNKVVYNFGPDINVINTRSSRPIQRLRLERQENISPGQGARSEAFKVQGDRLMVSAPMRVKVSAQVPAPPRLKAKVERARVDKGWSVVADPKAQTELRQKMKTQDSSKIPPPTAGAGAATQTTVGPSPATGTTPVTGTTPATSTTGAAAGAPSASPLERGQGKNRNRPGDRASGAGSSALGTPPSGAASPVETTTTPERGKGRKGGRGESPLNTPPSTSGAPGGAASPGETTTTPERGKGRKGGRGEPPTRTESPSAATSTGETSTTLPERGQHKGGKRGATEGTAPGGPATTAPSGGATAAPEGMSQGGEGKRGSRRSEPTGAAGAAGEGTQPQGAEGAGGGKHKGRAETTQPTNAGPGAAAGPEQHQGKGQGKHKPEASPAASPQ